MKPADQPNAVKFTAPGCFDLPVVRAEHPQYGLCLVTAWELSAEEVADVVRTGRIWVSLIGSQPPIFVTTNPPYETEPAVLENGAPSDQCHCNCSCRPPTACAVHAGEAQEVAVAL